MMLDGRPGDQRGFFHKKLLGGIASVAGVLPIPGAGTVSRIARSLAGGRATVPRTQTARVTQFSQGEKELGRSLKLGTAFRGGAGARQNGELLGGDPECIIPGQRVDPGTGECKFFLGTRAGPDGGFGVGEAVMGRYGAGLVPGSRIIDRAVCLRGMQLGDDGVCYNKSQISNKQRMWPAGRRPLLTGGDMRAISIASRAGRRLDGTTKRLRKLGMMKALPAPRKKATPAVHERLVEAHVTK